MPIWSLDLGVGVVAVRVLERDLRVGRGHTGDDGLELEELDLAGLLVELRLDLALGAELPPRGGEHRLLESVDHDLALDALVLHDLIDDRFRSTSTGHLLGFCGVSKGWKACRALDGGEVDAHVAGVTAHGRGRRRRTRRARL